MKKLISTILCVSFVLGIAFVPHNALANEVSPAAILKTESEPNDIIGTADLVNQDDTITGYISTDTDVDCFKVVASATGVFNFWLGNIPSGKNYDLYVYNSSGGPIGSSTNTGSTQELVSGITAVKGNTYYFLVRGVSGSYNATSAYKVRCKILMNDYTGFSQSDPGQSYTQFDTTNLDNLCSSGSSTSWLSRFKSAGCVIASYAMILRNLNATTSRSRYDFRTGSNGYLAADPFTVMLTNTSWPSIDENSDGSYTADTIADPVYASHGVIASAFGKTATKVSLEGLTDQEKAYAIAYFLSLHPEGIAVSFMSGSRTHTIVFTQTTVEVPDTYSPPITEILTVADYDIASDISVVDPYSPIVAAVSAYDNLFTVCDPAGYAPWGAPELFSASYAGTSYGFSTAYKIVFFA